MSTPTDPTLYGWWLASRAAGVTAFVLASVAVIAGLAMAGRVSRRPGMARALRAAHEQAALGALLAMAAHGALLLGDHWLHPSLAQIAIPFTAAYRPLATGLGIVAAYGAALLGLTFYLRKRIGARLWRRAHRLTIVVWALAAVHALTAGTDASTPWMRAILLASAIPIAALFTLRVAHGLRRPATRRPLVEAAR
ncbi:MAG TPA: hypothetical protein VFT50_01045 [Baekduia sp.]|nr:hypothetical protein [Baekduia sp.]